MVLETTTVKAKKSKATVASSAIKTVGARKPRSSAKSNSTDHHDKLLRIAVTAYYKAESRGFEPGHELQDWLEAEAEAEVAQ